MKYGSKSCSLRFFEVGGNRPKIWGPGIVRVPDEENVPPRGGDEGIPVLDALLDDLNFALTDGTGR
jgi:hypothetical protein